MPLGLLFKYRFSSPFPDASGGAPLVAFITSGGNWFVDNNNHTTPGGYAVSSDGINFFIDTGASSGNTLSVSGGNLFVTYP